MLFFFVLYDYCMGDRAVIFDFDGTLADTIGVALDIYNSILVPKFGTVPIQKSEIPELRKFGYKKVMKLKKVSIFDLARMLPIMPRLLKQRMDEVDPYAGVVEVIAELKRQGYKLGVLTSNDQSLVVGFLKNHNFPEFDFVIHERAIFGKEKALKKIVRRFNLERAKTIYVGDEPRDIVAAKKAGVLSIGVAWGVGGRMGLQPAGATVLIDKPSEILGTTHNLITKN